MHGGIHRLHGIALYTLCESFRHNETREIEKFIISLLKSSLLKVLWIMVDIYINIQNGP